jgi:hypothetical protein
MMKVQSTDPHERHVDLVREKGICEDENITSNPEKTCAGLAGPTKAGCQKDR